MVHTWILKLKTIDKWTNSALLVTQLVKHAVAQKKTDVVHATRKTRFMLYLLKEDVLMPVPLALLSELRCASTVD